MRELIGGRTRRPSSRASHRAVDVLVVRSSLTLGLARAEDELIDALREAGLSVASAQSDFRRVRPLFFAQPLVDLSQAFAIRAATTRELRTVEPRAIVFATTHAAMLQPASRLAIGAIRFDSLAATSRRGPRNLVQRALERRALALSRLLAPWTLQVGMWRDATASANAVVPLPPIVDEADLPAGPLEERVVGYTPDPHKKGLDVAVAAWSAAGASPPLVITGITRAAGETFLRRAGVEIPSGITWSGKLETRAFRRLTGRSSIYLSASRFEDHGLSQLEALFDGALLVTTPSAGPAEALALARRLDARLVADSFEPRSLACALQAAFAMTEDQRREYRQRARTLLAPYAGEVFRARLRDEILPVLLGR